MFLGAFLIKLLMLITSKLITKGNSCSFQFCYLQFEPLVLIAEGSYTLIVVVYAFSTGLTSLLNGGHETNFGIAIQMIPSALRILVPSVKQIIGVAPKDLHKEVQTVMDDFMRIYHFRDYVTSVQQYGNMEIIDIDILLKRDSIMTVAEMDMLRLEIDEALGGKDVEKWLTISFMAGRRWMTRDYDAVDED